MRRFGLISLACVLTGCGDSQSVKQQIAECQIEEAHRPLTPGANGLDGEYARGLDIELCMKARGWEILARTCPLPEMQADWQIHGFQVVDRAENDTCYAKIGGFSEFVDNLKK